VVDENAEQAKILFLAELDLSGVRWDQIEVTQLHRGAVLHKDAKFVN
jgi:hypothetical protein